MRSTQGGSTESLLRRLIQERVMEGWDECRWCKIRVLSTLDRYQGSRQSGRRAAAFTLPPGVNLSVRPPTVRPFGRAQRSAGTVARSCGQAALVAEERGENVSTPRRDYRLPHQHRDECRGRLRRTT
jgi:hypothetical protein